MRKRTAAQTSPCVHPVRRVDARRGIMGLKTRKPNRLISLPPGGYPRPPALREEIHLARFSLKSRGADRRFQHGRRAYRRRPEGDAFGGSFFKSDRLGGTRPPAGLADQALLVGGRAGIFPDGAGGAVAGANTAFDARVRHLPAKKGTPGAKRHQRSGRAQTTAPEPRPPDPTGQDQQYQHQRQPLVLEARQRQLQITQTGKIEQLGQWRSQCQQEIGGLLEAGQHHEGVERIGNVRSS